MHKLQVVLCSAVFSAAAVVGVSVAYAEEGQSVVQQPAEAGVQPAQTAAGSQAAENTVPDQSAAQTVQALAASADPYDVKSFFADFTHFSIGDTAPELYRSKQYEVTQWTVRHLPAPAADSHWTYMGGNYVMITNADGKILKAESGEIYYKH